MNENNDKCITRLRYVALLLLLVASASATHNQTPSSSSSGQSYQSALELVLDQNMLSTLKQEELMTVYRLFQTTGPMRCVIGDNKSKSGSKQNHG